MLQTSSMMKGINILKAHGNSAKESYLLKGYALNIGRASQGMPMKFSPVRIACLDFNLQKTKMQLGVQVFVTDPHELEKIRQREADVTKERVLMLSDFVSRRRYVRLDEYKLSQMESNKTVRKKNYQTKHSLSGYKNDPEILAMTNLIAAYQRNEILEFEKILKNNRRTIMDDPFIRNYIEDLLKNIRIQVLLKLIKPYTRIGIPFVSKELNVPEAILQRIIMKVSKVGIELIVDKEEYSEQQSEKVMHLVFLTALLDQQHQRLGHHLLLILRMGECNDKRIGST